MNRPFFGKDLRDGRLGTVALTKPWRGRGIKRGKPVVGKRILIVEDEVGISRVLKAYLVKAGYEVVQAFDGDEALRQFTACAPDLVLLDLMLPGKDGWSLLKEIRKQSSCPVMVLTALGQPKQKIAGLNQGADDYITKPFNGEEVVARVQAVLRRSPRILENPGTRQYGSLKIDFHAHTVSVKGVPLSFIPRDLSLFLFLARHPNQTFSREQLITEVWGLDYKGSERAVDLAVKRIRKALRHWPATEGEIKTFRGVGYQFCVYQE
ncbi:MAG: response regulator transcription factor [Firmicutes bacterium]|nr:response regulator transcription factor [Bacillota bacterium]